MYLFVVMKNAYLTDVFSLDIILNFKLSQIYCFSYLIKRKLYLKDILTIISRKKPILILNSMYLHFIIAHSSHHLKKSFL